MKAPTRAGYTFQYWEGSRYNPGDAYTVVGDHTFTAVWAKEGESAPSGRVVPKTGNDTPAKRVIPNTGDPTVAAWAGVAAAGAISLAASRRKRGE